MDGDGRGDDDNDFDFEQGDSNKRNNEGGDENTQKIDNHHYDEAVELSDEGSEIQSEANDDDGTAGGRQDFGQQQQDAPGDKKPFGDYDQDSQDDIKIPGAYDPADYNNLPVSGEVKELFKYIQRYRPVHLDLETELKAFIPDYIPAVGEVDAFIKPERPDGKEETLGLTQLDEPCLNQSKEAKVRLLLQTHGTVKTEYKHIDKIEGADKNPKAINRWIQDVTSINRLPPSVVYSKPFPDIDHLMQEWPSEVEEALQNFKAPSEEMDVSLEDFCKIACALVDIPVHGAPQNKNLIESLHVFFTLYSEFRANQYFQQNTNNDNNQYIYGGNN